MDIDPFEFSLQLPIHLKKSNICMIIIKKSRIKADICSALIKLILILLSWSK